VVALLLAAPSRASAYEVTDAVEVWSYVQVWATLWQEMEAVAGYSQPITGDTAADTVTGLALGRLRVGGDARILDGLLGFHLHVKLERNVSALDAYVDVTPRPWLSIRLGQFRIPSTWENMVENRQLDFPMRSQISRAVADFSLSRAFYSASQLGGNRSYRRDLGLGVEGELDRGPVPFRYWLMVGNGLGANLWIGGEGSQFAITNPPEFFYGARLEVEPLRDWITVGGHVTYNRHENMALGGSRVAVDLDRMSWSGDVRLSIPAIGGRLALMYAGGVIAEDYYGDGKDDLRYSGGVAQVVIGLSAVLRNLFAVPVPVGHDVQLELRYALCSYEVDESGRPTDQVDLSLGASYLFRQYIRAHVEYTRRRTDDPTEPDLADDLVILSVLAAI